MEIPPALRDRALNAFVSAVPKTESMSLMGDKVLILTYENETELIAYVHDTGGLLGDAETHRQVLSPDKFHLIAPSVSEELWGFVKFPGKKCAGFSVEAEMAAVTLQHLETYFRVDRQADFDSGVEVAVHAAFEEDRDKLVVSALDIQTEDLTFIDSVSQSELNMPNWFLHMKTNRSMAPAKLVIHEQLFVGEFYARVLVKDGRLSLRRGDLELMDLPLDRIRWGSGENARQVKLENQLTLVGQIVNGLTITLPETQANNFAVLRERTALQAGSDVSARGDGSGLSSVIQLTGRLPGGPVDQRADILISSDAIELRTTTGQPLASFDLNSSWVRVAGSSEEFVIFDQKAGPLKVTSDSSAFRERLQAHEVVREAAVRTTERGPYPLYFGEEGVAMVHGDEQALCVKAVKFEQKIPYEHIEQVDGPTMNDSWALQLKIGGVQFPVSGQVEILQSFHADLKGRMLGIQTPPVKSEELSKSILHLEGDYFTFTLFSPFLLLNDLFDKENALGEIQGRDELLKGLALMAHGMDSLSDHLDMCLHYFPTWTAARDAEMLQGMMEPAKVLKLRKEQERGLRLAVAGLAPLNGEVQRLNMILANRVGFLPKGDNLNYASLALSLVGATFNPILLVGGAHQLTSMLGSGAREEKFSEESLSNLHNRVLDRWTYLLDTLVPLLSYQLSENLFPPRIRLAKAVSSSAGDSDEAEERVRKRLALRRSRLECILGYPVEDGNFATRQSLVDRMRERRDSIQYAGFRRF